MNESEPPENATPLLPRVSVSFLHDKNFIPIFLKLHPSGLHLLSRPANSLVEIGGNICHAWLVVLSSVKRPWAITFFYSSYYAYKHYKIIIQNNCTQVLSNNLMCYWVSIRSSERSLCKLTTAFRTSTILLLRTDMASGRSSSGVYGPSDSTWTIGLLVRWPAI